MNLFCAIKKCTFVPCLSIVKLKRLLNIQLIYFFASLPPLLLVETQNQKNAQERSQKERQ